MIVLAWFIIVGLIILAGFTLVGATFVHWYMEGKRKRLAQQAIKDEQALLGRP